MKLGWNFGLRVSDCGLGVALWLAFVVCGAFGVDLRMATFKVDVTPPAGAPLCDGLVPPATGVNDPLTA
jgi:hypothetical protein